MEKNAFYFSLKDLLVLQILFFLSCPFSHLGADSLKEVIAIHILPNISNSKSNQTMKFGQLIEFNLRNLTQCKVEKLFP